MSVTLTFVSDVSSLQPKCDRLILGRKKELLSDAVLESLPDGLDASLWKRLVESEETGDDGRLVTTLTENYRIYAGILPEPCSRYNSPARTWAIPKLVRSVGKRNITIVAALSNANHAMATAIAISKAVPRYSAKNKAKERQVEVAFLSPSGGLGSMASVQVTADAVRTAAELVDLPPNVLTTDAFVQRAEELAEQIPDVTCRVIRGQELEEQGFGGLWAVGRASMTPPALVVLDWTPSNPPQRQCWVGKGIVYDTGGLSIKSKTGMVGMKNDMGGSAAVFAAFEAAARLRSPLAITAILCIAENSVGAGATRPDDVVRMYSKRTVEINNTDAEGRLVLADGLAWAVRHRNPEVLIDMATLTGAQGVATGRQHAALYCNTEALEQAAVIAGRQTGDLAHPLPYAPELFRKEFSSEIADMRNSVKNRNNAQASCAGQFLRNHLGKYKGSWLHIDMAAPSTANGRGTGYGVGLLLALANVIR